MTYKRTKSRLFIYGLLVIVVLVALAPVIVRLNQHGNITRANYDKIKLGMMIAEVEAFLGAPSDDPLQPLTYRDIHADESALWIYPPPHEVRYWTDNTHRITVFSDSQGRIAGKSYSRDPDISLVRRIIDWLGI